MVPLPLYLAFGVLLFVIGVVGVLTRRNAIIVLMSIELMLNAVNLTFQFLTLFTRSPRSGIHPVYHRCRRL